ncbi:hypothetical protein [uncultured Nevskia sp.]|nr:hypothetical protein [uncultured Nevskia sp.]
MNHPGAGPERTAEIAAKVEAFVRKIVAPSERQADASDGCIALIT